MVVVSHLKQKTNFLRIAKCSILFYLLQSLLWQKGWPLTSIDGALLLHLGSIDDSLVRIQDIYLCIRSVTSNVSPKLFACWRRSLSDSIVYHELDPAKRKLIESALEICI